MRTADYKLAGDIPEALKGKVVKTREAESLEELHQLVENGDEKHILRLAQGQLDIITQRKVREYVGSDEVGNILAGKIVGEGEDAIDFSEMSDEERVQEVLNRAQAVSDDYAYGSRTTTPGGGKTAAVERDKKVRAAAQADPELAAKLAALGITL